MATLPGGTLTVPPETFITMPHEVVVPIPGPKLITAPEEYRPSDDVPSYQTVTFTLSTATAMESLRMAYSAPWDSWISTTAATTDSTWFTWTDDTTTNGAITTDATYGYQTLRPEQVTWYDDRIEYRMRVEGDFTVHPPSEAERRTREFNERMRASQIRTRRQAAVAKERAEILLQRILTPEQWHDWRRFRSVRVQGRKHIYEVGFGVQGNVIELDKQGAPKRELCLQVGDVSGGGYNKEDQLAALVLGLQTDEKRMRQLANVHRSRFDEAEARRIQARRRHIRAA